MKNKITISTEIIAPVEKVWKLWTTPDDIMQWNNASEDWHTTRAVNDVSEGGKFESRMEAKDGSFGFDFGGTYITVEIEHELEYKLDDDRMVHVLFDFENGITTITQTFEAETENTLELQKNGWQAILTNFKNYVESKV